jgi:hypothetical protein
MKLQGPGSQLRTRLRAMAMSSSPSMTTTNHAAPSHFAAVKFAASGWGSDPSGEGSRLVEDQRQLTLRLACGLESDRLVDRTPSWR